MSKEEKPTIVYAVAQNDYAIFEAAFSAVYTSLERAKKHADEDYKELVEAEVEDCFPVVYECVLDSGRVHGPIYEAGNREKP